MEWQATNTIGDCPKPVTIWSQADIGEVVETPTGQQANEALSKETLQCPDLAAMGAQRGRATLGKPAPDGTFHRRAAAKATCGTIHGSTRHVLHGPNWPSG